MPIASSAKTSNPTSRRPLRVGFLALTDAAPLIAAQELGLYGRHGIRVELRREVGWATIRDKIAFGELDFAHAPAPMLWDVALGLNAAPCPVLTALVLNLHGNAITLSNSLYGGERDGFPALVSAVRTRQGEQRVTFGVVSEYSSHNLFLRSWLGGLGIVPGRDVRVVVVPPAQMFRNLVAGTIDGYCAGEPWNTLAVREGAGWCPAWSAEASPGHVEKVLMTTSRFAGERPDEHAALVAALSDAAAWCDEPPNREPLAAMLAAAPYLNLPVRVIAPALTGRFDRGHSRIELVPDFHVFHRGNAGVPDAQKADVLHGELVAAGLMPRGTDPHLPRRLFREDLHRDALQHQTHELVPSSDLRGVARQNG